MSAPPPHARSVHHVPRTPVRYVPGLYNSQEGLHHPRLLSSLVGHTETFKAIFVPGGHAPMIDLAKDRDLGQILGEFHTTGRPTALICHGPMALISTLPDAEGFDAALNSDDKAALPALAHGFPYAGYRAAVFSKAEELQTRGPARRAGAILE